MKYERVYPEEFPSDPSAQKFERQGFPPVKRPGKKTKNMRLDYGRDQMGRFNHINVIGTER